jgi:hypothetical protein
MASIHFSEIQRLLAEQGQIDAEPGGAEGFFVEIRFDDPQRASDVIDPAFQDKVITADCPYGTVTIEFDHQGLLKSIDVS